MNTENISKIYDYIVNVTETQSRLLDEWILFGDGTRFNNDRKTFSVVYNYIKTAMIENNLIDSNNKVRG